MQLPNRIVYVDINKIGGFPIRVNFVDTYNSLHKYAWIFIIYYGPKACKVGS